MGKILTFAFFAVLLAGVAIFSFSREELVEELQTHSAGRIETAGVTRIWFSPTGELIGTGVEDAQLTVRVWSAKGALARERKVAVEGAEFAVAQDASKIALASGAQLRIQNLTGPAAASGSELKLKREPPVMAVAFTASGAVAVLYSGGGLELWDPAGGKMIASASAPLSEKAPLLSSGAYLATWSLSTHDVFVFDTGEGTKLSLVELKKYAPDFLSATLSNAARFAVGTKERVEAGAHSLVAPGPVRSLAFYDRDRVFAAGDFPGIYLLSAAEGPHQIAPGEPGSTLLAANSFELAFGNGKRIDLFTHKLVKARVNKGTAGLPPWLMYALIGVLIPVAVYVSYSAVRLFRKRRKKRLEEILVARPEDESPVPIELIEACHNGDCVLYAGTGLGAQAGLPVWSDFLKELGERAGVQNLPTNPHDPRADRIAALFEERKSELLAFLRGRFLTPVAIPKAHQVIRDIEFPTIISIGFDNLLDRVIPYAAGRVNTSRDSELLLRTSVQRREFFLMKLYGDLDEPDTIRLGPRQCAEAMIGNPATEELIRELLQTRTLLFVGASLESLERDLEGFLAGQPAGRKHFALVPDPGPAGSGMVERLAARYSVRALPYTPSSAEHPEVVEFLVKLLAGIRERTRSKEYLLDEQ